MVVYITKIGVNSTYITFVGLVCNDEELLMRCFIGETHLKLLKKCLVEEIDRLLLKIINE
jgi:hypothetical protein